MISQIIYSRLIWSEGNMIADKKKYVLIGLTIAAIFFHSELIKFFLTIWNPPLDVWSIFQKETFKFQV